MSESWEEGGKKWVEEHGGWEKVCPETNYTPIWEIMRQRLAEFQRLRKIAERN